MKNTYQLKYLKNEKSTMIEKQKQEVIPTEIIRGIIGY